LAVEHPGYVGQAAEGLPYERRLESACRVPPGAAKKYFCGGVQGGQASQYLDACAEMASWIQSDLDRDIIPVWHDESAWNRYCALNPPTTVWGPEYCSPEHEGNPGARIIALDKNHDAFRETPWLRRGVVGARRFAGRARGAAVRVRRVAHSAR
jgi:histo-blood group ABO system transferase